MIGRSEVEFWEHLVTAVVLGFAWLAARVSTKEMRKTYARVNEWMEYVYELEKRMDRQEKRLKKLEEQKEVAP